MTKIIPIPEENPLSLLFRHQRIIQLKILKMEIKLNLNSQVFPIQHHPSFPEPSKEISKLKCCMQILKFVILFAFYSQDIFADF